MKLAPCLLLFLVAFASAEAQVAAETAPPFLEKDRLELIALLTGRWDNDRHVFFAREAGMDEDAIAPRQHLVIESIEGHPFNLKARREVSSQAPVTIVHGFSLEPKAGQIRQAMMADDGRYLDCDILWRRRAGGFTGTAEGEGCGIVFPEPRADGRGSVALDVSAEEFWVRVTRGGRLIESRFHRARMFNCWSAVLRGAKHGDSGEEREEWHYRENLSVHDQNGEAAWLTDEIPPRTVRLRLRNVDWPFGTRRPSLTLYVHEGDDQRAVSYAWAEANANRIGINLRWLQASCTYDPQSKD